MSFVLDPSAPGRHDEERIPDRLSEENTEAQTGIDSRAARMPLDFAYLSSPSTKTTTCP